MSRHRRLLRALGPALLLAVGGAYALASWNWCGVWGTGDVTVVSGAEQGPLSAGAAVARLTPPWPVVVAGYPPPRPEATRAALPLSARALVLGTGGTRVGLVTVDLLTLPEGVAEDVRAAVADVKLSELWVLATHSHSSLGGYENTLVSQLAGTGRFKAPARAAVVDAAAKAVREAAGRLVPVALEVGEGSLGDLTQPRDDEEKADARAVLARLRGADGKAVAELVLVSAHPTLWPRGKDVLSPDYPGFLAAAREPESGVTLVLQGAVGNATPHLAGAPRDERVQAYVTALQAQLALVKPTPAEVTRLAFSRATVPLPRPDASRLVPVLFRAAGDNFLCSSAPRQARVSMLAVGPLRLVAVPGEATFAAGERLEAATHARVVSLANGYLGYVNTPEHVREGRAESQRQYYGPKLLEALEAAARAAAQRL